MISKIQSENKLEMGIFDYFHANSDLLLLQTDLQEVRSLVELAGWHLIETVEDLPEDSRLVLVFRESKKYPYDVARVCKSFTGKIEWCDIRSNSLPIGFPNIIAWREIPEININLPSQ
jgi:hypothetical protein